MNVILFVQYLGNYTKESVKRRCIELMYLWSINLKNEPKIAEAYAMAKQEGIVKYDPIVSDPVSNCR
jgi:ADP-ribosylation factor-binding protein GGA